MVRYIVPILTIWVASGCSQVDRQEASPITIDAQLATATTHISQQEAIDIALKSESIMPRLADNEGQTMPPHDIRADLVSYREIVADVSLLTNPDETVWIDSMEGSWGHPYPDRAAEQARYHRIEFIINASVGEMEGLSAFVR